MVVSTNSVLLSKGMEDRSRPSKVHHVSITPLEKDDASGEAMPYIQEKETPSSTSGTGTEQENVAGKESGAIVASLPACTRRSSDARWCCRQRSGCGGQRRWVCLRVSRLRLPAMMMCSCLLFCERGRNRHKNDVGVKGMESWNYCGILARSRISQILIIHTQECL